MAMEYAHPKTSIWKYRNFTFLLSASLLLSIGNKIYELLLPLIMYDLSGGSPIVMTSMRTAELLPNLFFGIFVGVVVDRVDKKKWALTMILLQAAGLTVLYFMFGAEIETHVLFYLLGFILMTLNYGFFNVQVSLVKASVPMTFLTEANSKFSFAETFVGIMGPVFLGIVLMAADKTEGLLITVFLYLAAYLLIHNLVLDEPVQLQKRQSFWLDFKEGWHAFRGNRALWMITLFIIMVNCSGIVVGNTVLIFGTADLQLPTSKLSIMLSFGGMGGLLASLLISRLRKKFNLGPLFGFSILLNAMAYLGLRFTTEPILFAVFLFLNGFAVTVYLVCAYTFRHEQTPVQLMGRIAGLTGTFFRIGMPAAMLFSGWMVTWWGTDSVFASAAVFNLVVFLLYRQTKLWAEK
ncbi:MFS transporter [Heyndrickxia sp. MSNUG]|uniref:MFS transporter n=1 Tax=Heyndrickxia sp. MSNUG TaxID=3136677 RepID=UPI003C2BD628